MFKTTVAAIALLLLGAAFLAAGEQAEKTGEMGWFDLQNCAFCKHLAKDPHLMENVKWEHHDISNGVVTITVVAPEYKKAYMEAETAMMDLGKKMETGEVNPMEVPMCGHCQTWGKLIMMGSKVDHVAGELAEVVIMTSDKPELVAEIKAFAQKNREEMAKWEKMEKPKKS